MTDDESKFSNEATIKGMRFGYGRGQPSAYAPKQRFGKPQEHKERPQIHDRIEETREKIQSRREGDGRSQNNPLLKAGFEVQQTEFSRENHLLATKFRASFSREDEKALAEHLGKNNFRLGLYKEVEKDVQSEIADIAFSGTVERPRAGFSSRYKDIVDFPYKYSVTPHKPEDYDLSKSMWSKMRALPEFAAIEKKVVTEMAKAGIPPDILPEMSLNDFKHFFAVHCNVGGGYAYSKIFPQTDEKGNVLRDRNGKIVTTSAKQKATIEFITKNEKEFHDLMMKQPHAKQGYVNTLVQEMKRGSTDMTKYLSQHPDWKDQTAINLHHIVGKKDARLLESMGLSFEHINSLNNLCVMDCGTVGLLAEKQNDTSKYVRILAGTHGEAHNHETTFRNARMHKPSKWGEKTPPTEDGVIMRIEPAPGVACMIGVNGVIMDEQRKTFDLEHRCRPDLHPDGLNEQSNQPVNKDYGAELS